MHLLLEVGEKNAFPLSPRPLNKYIITPSTKSWMVPKKNHYKVRRTPLIMIAMLDP